MSLLVFRKNILDSIDFDEWNLNMRVTMAILVGCLICHFARTLIDFYKQSHTALNELVLV